MDTLLHSVSLTGVDAPLRESGIAVVGNLPWGSHFCQFYATRQDLLDIQLPYIAAGLAAGEYCLWVTAEPLPADAAAEALAAVVGDLGPYLRAGQLEILDQAQWYTTGGIPDVERVRRKWLDRLADARQRGFAGLRFAGNTCGVAESNRSAFSAYGEALDHLIAGQSMLALCSFYLPGCSTVDVMDILSTHSFALHHRDGGWQVIEHTEQKRQEAALRESEARFRVAQELSPDGFVILRPERDVLGRIVDFTFVYQNAASARMNGTDAEVVVGRRLLELFPGLRGSPNLEAYQQVADHGEPRVLEVHYGGDAIQTPTWFRLAVVSMGKDIVVLSQDITAHKQTEEELKRLLARVKRQAAELEANFTAIADGLIVYDAEGNIVKMNAEARRLSGYDHDESWQPPPTRMRLRQMSRTDGSPFQWEETPTYRALLRGETVIGETMVLHLPDRTYWIAVSAAPIRLEDGTTRGVVATLTDITPLHELQEQMKDFVHMVSHDLRMPMTSMKGHADILQERLTQAEDRQARRSAEVIARGITRMNVMIDDLVEVARLEGGQRRLHRQPVALAAYLADLLARNAPPLEAHRLHLDLPDDLPPVCADPDRLERILLNLLTNAQKYSAPATPIGVQARPCGDAVTIRVTDEGRGIHPDDLPHLFTRFYRAKGERRADGIGLGLYITKLLVEAHGGHIRVDSAMGTGSTFEFTLPVG